MDDRRRERTLVRFDAVEHGCYTASRVPGYMGVALQGGTMSSHKAVVETYFEGFRRRDHAQILACLTDDVAWDIHGHTQLVGKEAFDREIERPDATGGPVLTVDRLIEEADTVVALGIGEG